jgi:hypothetical protein
MLKPVEAAPRRHSDVVLPSRSSENLYVGSEVLLGIPAEGHHEVADTVHALFKVTAERAILHKLTDHSLPTADLCANRMQLISGGGQFLDKAAAFLQLSDTAFAGIDLDPHRFQIIHGLTGIIPEFTDFAII